MKPKTALEEKVIEALRTAAAPLTPKQILQALPESWGANEARDMPDSLDRLQQSGLVHEYPPKQKGHPLRYGLIPPLQWVRTRILARVEESGGRITEGQLKDGLAKWEGRLCDEALGGLIRSGALYHLKVLRKYVVSRAPTPFDHLLQRQVTSLKEILARINRQRAKPLTLDQLRSFLDGAIAPSAGARTEQEELTEKILRDWYELDVPLRGGVTSVPIPWTWKRYGAWRAEQGGTASLAEFQAMFRNLFQAGKIELIPHSRTQEIPHGEREVALSGPSGELLFYWKWR